MGDETPEQDRGFVDPAPETQPPQPISSTQQRATARARTTPPPPPLLDQALEELTTCLASLRVAEEALRVQNVALKERCLARLAERRRYLDLLACVPDALLVTDADGLILESNPAAARLLSGSARLHTGKTIARFFTRDRRVALLGVMEAAGGGVVWEGSLWIKPRRGVEFWASVTVTPVPTVGNAPPALRWLIRPA